MRKVEVTALDVARRFLGIQEIPGAENNPFIEWAHSLCDEGALHTPDEVAWCSSFAQVPSFLLGLPRSKSRRARSWLRIGQPVDLAIAEPGFDVVVLKRGSGVQPGPDVLDAQGHVGFFVSTDLVYVQVLAGNQGNAVNIAPFLASSVLSVRRLLA